MSAAGVSGLPVLRTLSSKRFRLLLAFMLAGFGIILDVVFLVLLDTPEVPWLEDFEPYYAASVQLLDGASPYTAEQLGAPIDAVCPGCYLYPPFLAQLITPLTLVSMDTAKIIWFGLMAVIAVISVWLATGIGGASRSLERAAWSVVAVTLFFPVFHSNWLGNVGTLVGLSVTLVALGGIAGGLGATFGTLLKVVPGTLLPVAFVADRRSRRSLIISLVAVGAVCFVLAPAAWLEYPTVLRNMLSGSADVHWNLAPVTMAERNGFSDLAVSAIRLTTYFVGGVAIVGSVWAALKPGGLPMAALLATVAMLVVPGTLWYHYLAVTLPLAAMAWPSAGVVVRPLLLLSAAGVSISGMSVMPIGITFFFLVAMLALAGWVLWPRSNRSAGVSAAMPAGASPGGVPSAG